MARCTHDGGGGAAVPLGRNSAKAQVRLEQEGGREGWACASCVVLCTRMVQACLASMHAAALLPRWLLRGTKVYGIDLWLCIHPVCQLLGLALFIAAFGIAWNKFPTPPSGA